eukprot:GILI01016015.1.p1 GENE.GILI01016015.1~~GILI01016015.1.p1  ORF type:complete len:424 (-),score=57.87 GILI01016015.1:85-1356(-)
MYDNELSRQRQPPRGDTPVDLIRYVDRGHVPPNNKKVRSVVGRSNRHEADPATNGRTSYREPIISNAHNSTIFNRSQGNGASDSAFLDSGYRPLSTPNSFLHSTRPASSLSSYNAVAIPKLKDEDRAVDSLANLLRDSVMVTKSPNALIHMGGSGHEDIGLGVPTLYNHRAHSAMSTLSSNRANAFGAPMPDPRGVLRSVREERARGESNLSTQRTAVGAPGYVPMATSEDSRSRLFHARAGSALSGSGPSVLGAEASSLMSASQRIGRGENPHANRSSSKADKPDPLFFSQGPIPASTVQHNASNSAARSVFASLQNDALRPRLRFELTDYHNTHQHIQAPVSSAMGVTSSQLYGAGDRGLRSNLLGQEDKLKKAARSAAHAETIRGLADRVRDNVDAEGSRMRTLRENRSVLWASNYSSNI